MTDINETVVYRGRLGSLGLCYLIAEATKVSTNDTITLGEFTVITAVSTYRLDTGVSITSTAANNVVTITQATLTTVPVLVCATGH